MRAVYITIKILDAIKNKDSELSAALMKEHIDTTMVKIKRYKQKLIM